MDNRKELTRRLIADSFKELLKRRSFEKISIMDITDEAGIRRPSFYNHFQDKYDLLEWIVAEDVIAPSAQLMESGKYRDALQSMIAAIAADASFYRKAFSVIGQNGFEEAFIRRLENVLADYLPQNTAALPPSLSATDLSHIRAMRFVSLMKWWLESGRTTDAKDICAACAYLSLHPLW